MATAKKSKTSVRTRARKKYANRFRKALKGPKESIGKWSKLTPHKELFYRAAGSRSFFGKALEIGCEDGVDCFYLTKKGFDITGVDSKKGAIGSAKKRALMLRMPITFIACNPSKLPFKNSSFDAVYTKYSMRKLREKRVIPEIARVLKKGGIAYFACGIASIDTKRKAVDPKQPRPIKWHARKKDIVKILEKNFEIIEMQKYSVTATKPSPTHVHKDFFLVARKK